MRLVDTEPTMPAASQTEPESAPSTRRLGVGLLMAAVLSLAGAGLLLWRWQGDAVFGQYLLGALAWCF